MDYTGGNPSNDHTCCIVWSSITPVIRWAQNSTAFPPIMFLNKKHRHHCDTDLSKKKGTLDVLTFDHIFSAKGQKDPVACLSCLARSWCEQKGYNKQKQGKYSLQTYIRSYNIYIYNAYIMHIPPTKWDVSKFLGPKKSRKKKVECLRNFGACPTWMVDPPKLWSSTKIEVDFFITKGANSNNSNTQTPRDVRFIFSMRSNFLRASSGRPNETMKLLTTCLE